MKDRHYDPRKAFERGAVILSFDTEQIWGYVDLLDETQFENRYPGAIAIHEKLLKCLCSAGISATWFVVGGMTLRASEGAHDIRMCGLPKAWTNRIPAGTETTKPLWYRRSFVDRLRKAWPTQEIGLHGGLTHFIWTDKLATREVVTRELSEGVQALEQSHVSPSSFSFGREQEAYCELLPKFGIHSYRSRTPVLASQLGRTLPGAVLRLVDELARSTPPPVWPVETLPGLWNIPSSLFLYPIGPSRVRLAALPSRIQRFKRGLEAAMRSRGIFHFCLHPENLAESRSGFTLFEDIVNHLAKSRDRGDVEILTMREVTNRMESLREKPSAPHLGWPHDSLATIASRVSRVS
jgi:hypothetical protein